jgi:hypothetical protein
VRFGQISSEIEEIIGKMTNPTILEELLKLAATANSLGEFKQSLAKIQSYNFFRNPFSLRNPFSCNINFCYSGLERLGIV